jgi:hypothetical protein
VSRTGLPDGLFSYQKFQFWKILERLGMENFAIFYDHLEYFTAIRYILSQFGRFGGNFDIFFLVLVCLEEKKSGNPGHGARFFFDNSKKKFSAAKSCSRSVNSTAS